MDIDERVQLYSQDILVVADTRKGATQLYKDIKNRYKENLHDFTDKCLKLTFKNGSTLNVIGIKYDSQLKYYTEVKTRIYWIDISSHSDYTVNYITQRFLSGGGSSLALSSKSLEGNKKLTWLRHASLV